MYYYKTWNLLNEIPLEEKGLGVSQSLLVNEVQVTDSANVNKQLSFYPVKYLLKFLIQ